MAIARYRPLFDLDSDIQNLQREMNRLFNGATPWEGNTFVPAAEISETNDAILLKIEVPGMNKEDLNVEVMAEVVKIHGERKSESTKEENGSKRTEFRYGRFERVVRLPGEVKNTEAKAEYKGGILSLTLPKRQPESAKVHKVQL